MKRWWLVLVLLLFGCMTGGSTVPPPTARATPLAALLAVSLCPEVERRTFSVESGHDGVVDTYVHVTECGAHADGDDVAFRADALARVAVDQTFGPVSVTSFVHATVHVESRARASARDVGGRLEVTLTPRSAPVVDVQPVGLLDPAPQNWAALIGIVLAPSVGVLPETFAKQRLKNDSEQALRNALMRPLTFTYDAHAGTVLVTDSPAGCVRIRVVPHGNAEVGRFPRTASTTIVHGRAPLPVAVRGVCLSHAEHLLDTDRRGDAVTTDDWPVVDGEFRVEVPPMPCAWTVALRTLDERAAIVEVDDPAPRAARGDDLDSPDRWIAFDAVTIEPAEDEGFRVMLSTDAWHFTVDAHDAAFPAIAVLAPDERIRVRLLRRDGTRLVPVSDQPLDVEWTGNSQMTLTLLRSDDAPTTTLRLRARMHVPEQPLR
jgi:hypothetical protein